MGEPRMAKQARARWASPQDWSEWQQYLAAGLDARNRWRLPVVLFGMLFGRGRRTVTSWLRAAGISTDYEDYYYFLSGIGIKASLLAERLLILILQVLAWPERLLLVIDDTPTKRYGPKVEGADIHHNPTPGPADQSYLYGHIWVTISLAVRHPLWGPWPCRCGPCCTCGSGRWRRFLPGGAGSFARSWSWQASCCSGLPGS